MLDVERALNAWVAHMLHDYEEQRALAGPVTEPQAKKAYDNQLTVLIKVEEDRRGVRGWRKLHIGVEEGGIIVAETVTDSGTDDVSAVHNLLDQIEVDIERFTGDGAYDKWSVYEGLAPRGTTVVVPPSKTAVESRTDTPAGRARNATVARVREIG